jgi:hypothetical protein
VVIHSPNSSATGAPVATIRRSIASVEPVARRLNALGSRAIGELLLELCGDDADKWARVERYAGMDPSMLAIVGGDRYPARPDLRVVGGRRHG